MQKNLNNVSRQFARQVTRGPKCNLAWAGFIFLGTFTLGMAISTLSSYLYSEGTGQDFKKEWLAQRHERLPAELLTPLSFAVLFLLSTVLEFGGAKEDAKRFAELAIERYMRNANVDTSKFKSAYLRDAAELLIANMPQSVRKEVVSIGVELDKKLDDSFMKHPKKRTILFGKAIKEVSNRIDLMLVDNPELEKSLLLVLQGIKPVQQQTQVKSK